jgi:hypothetical protein
VASAPAAAEDLSLGVAAGATLTGMRGLTLLLVLALGCSTETGEPATTAATGSAGSGSAGSGSGGSGTGGASSVGGGGSGSVSLLASGEFSVPAAEAFGDPGFHEAFQQVVPLSADVGSTLGRTLAVRMWDVSRPEQTCSEDHPLSGCATVDWSDADSRPNVPPGGVFDNRLRLVLASGARDYYLSETLMLTDMPDSYSVT